jgi:hypothetical protein
MKEISSSASLNENVIGSRARHELVPRITKIIAQAKNQETRDMGSSTPKIPETIA